MSDTRLIRIKQSTKDMLDTLKIHKKATYDDALNTLFRISGVLD